MKKRAFIAPLAASVAALIGGSTEAANAAVIGRDLTGTDLENQVPAAGGKIPGFVLDRSQEKNGGRIFADHSSHASHDSHSSHSSHSSGY